MTLRAFQFLILAMAALAMTACSDSSACPAGQIECLDRDGATQCIDACNDDQVVCDCVCIDDFDATLTDLQTAVFDGSCAFTSCHGENNPQANLQLTSVEVSEQNLINVESQQVPGVDRVVPFDLAGSYLIGKVTNTDIAPGTLPMPLGDGFPLCEAKLSAIEVWVAEGAPIE